jgi:hypothetical protein
MIVNSSQGGGSKDTWVLEDDGDGFTERGRAGADSWARPRMPDLRTGDWTGQQQQQQQHSAS